MIEETIALGVEAEHFLNSTLGKTIAEYARLETEDALDKLAVIDPTETEKIRQLQNVIARHADFRGWIEGIIVDGQSAYDEYIANEE